MGGQYQANAVGEVRGFRVALLLQYVGCDVHLFRSRKLLNFAVFGLLSSAGLFLASHDH